MRKIGFNGILHKATFRYEDLKLISTNAPVGPCEPPENVTWPP